jgi:hypothetical protein
LIQSDPVISMRVCMTVHKKNHQNVGINSLPVQLQCVTIIFPKRQVNLYRLLPHDLVDIITNATCKNWVGDMRCQPASVLWL